MCLIVFAHRRHAGYPFVFAANRDEFFERPTAPAGFWEDAPEVLAGRDLEAGGTWCGITRTGRFGAITNYREPSRQLAGAPSRGDLVAAFLRGAEAPEAYLRRRAAEAHRYNGFNLIVGDLQRLFYFSNRDGDVRELPPGIYGLSNHLLDTPWPKVTLARAMLEERLASSVLDPEPFFQLLADETRALDEALPDTGVGRQWEQVLSPIFIRSPRYGTRASTVIWVERDGRVTFFERSFGAPEEVPETRRFQFVLEPSSV